MKDQHLKKNYPLDSNLRKENLVSTEYMCSGLDEYIMKRLAVTPVASHVTKKPTNLKSHEPSWLELGAMGIHVTSWIPMSGKFLKILSLILNLLSLFTGSISQGRKPL